jgi:3-oxoacyl-[acyl-carrier-protein] synthase-3
LPRARIISTGSYLPERILTNHELERMVETTDEWITERSGIRQRCVAGAKQACSDLAYEAAKISLKNADLKAKDLDLILLATLTPDSLLPSAGCVLQDKLGAKNIPAFDLNAACSGFLYALSVANAYIRGGIYKRILVVGAEVLSKVTDWEDRTTCVIFGDGAGAAVLEATNEDRGILSIDLYADGSMGDLLMIHAGGSRMPSSTESVAKRLHYIKMKGNETFKFAVKTLEKLVVETLEKNKMKPSELALLIPHQANLRIIKATAERLGLPMSKVLVNIDRTGNTSAASIPIALDEAVSTGRLRPGDNVLLEAFGGGLTWASALIRW